MVDLFPGGQVRDLEQQLAASTQQRNATEEELLGARVPQKTSPLDKNLGHIRNMEKEKREAFEVCGSVRCVSKG